jgi:hypothetical protein
MNDFFYHYLISLKKLFVIFLNLCVSLWAEQPMLFGHLTESIWIFPSLFFGFKKKLLTTSDNVTLEEVGILYVDPNHPS